MLKLTVPAFNDFLAVFAVALSGCFFFFDSGEGLFVSFSIVMTSLLVAPQSSCSSENKRRMVTTLPSFSLHENVIGFAFPPLHASCGSVPGGKTILKPRSKLMKQVGGML